MEPVLVGAVAYTANVVPIWEGIRELLRGSSRRRWTSCCSPTTSVRSRRCSPATSTSPGTPTSPGCAHRRTHRVVRARALATRDTDLVFQTLMSAGAGSGLDELDRLKGARVALGSRDSGQARILPLHFLARRRDHHRRRRPGHLRLRRRQARRHRPLATSTPCVRCSTTTPTSPPSASTPGGQLTAGGDAVGDLEVVWESERTATATSRALDSPWTRTGPRPGSRTCWRWTGTNPEHRRILELEGLTRVEVRPSSRATNR